MKRCGDEIDCSPICNHCAYFHGDLGEGVCTLTSKRISASEECDEFVCFNVTPRVSLAVQKED